MTDHGFISLGKYSTARDSILHFLCVSDWANDSTGNSEAPTGYFWKISNDPADVATINAEFQSVIEEWFLESPEVTDSPALRAELVGDFIVSTDDQGFVYVESFESAARRDAEYSTRELAYWDWEGQEDD